jgi:hypothetical protein
MLFRNKCEACGFWTVFRVTVRYFKAHETCTYCGCETTIRWNGEAKDLVCRNEKLLTDLESICTELQLLKKPGDHVRLPMAGLEKPR